MNKGFIVAAFATLMVTTASFDAAAQDAALEAQLKELAKSPPDVATAGKWFKLKDSVTDNGLCQEILKASAAALILSKKSDVYQARVRPLLDDATGFEESFLAPCSECGGDGTSSKTCTVCKGSGRCHYANCQGGRHRVQQINGDKYENCRECKGSGRCQKCGGKGNLNGKCIRCGGKGQSFNNDFARNAYQAHANAAAHWDGSKKGIGGLSATEAPAYPTHSPSTVASGPANATQRRTPQGHPSAGISQSDAKSVYRSLMDKTRSNNGDLDDEFDFTEYKKWKAKDATNIQKTKIVEMLFDEGFKSGLYKDYIRCYHARVPDGLSFVVNEVKDRDYRRLGQIGPHFYDVTIELMCEGQRYKIADGYEKWNGPAWQNRDLRRYLSDEVLLSSHLSLLIPIDDEEVEAWKKGKILISSDWIYDIHVWNGVATYTDGTRKQVKKIQSSGKVFRSMDEREELEDGFEGDFLIDEDD